MRSQTIIAALTVFAGLVTAFPQGGAPGAGLTRRGKDYTPEPECVECPPDDDCDECTKGCIYIECDEKCEKEDCCKCLGLEEETPYVLEPPPLTILIVSSSTTQFLTVVRQTFKSTLLPA